MESRVKYETGCRQLALPKTHLGRPPATVFGARMSVGSCRVISHLIEGS